MGERQEVRDFENNHLFIEFPELYKYDYPDTGKRTYKKKPPDSFYMWRRGFLVEYKLPGNIIETHQLKELIKAYCAGALSFIATINPDKSIVFESISSDKTYVLEYNNGYKDLNELFNKLTAIHRGVKMTRKEILIFLLERLPKKSKIYRDIEAELNEKS